MQTNKKETVSVLRWVKASETPVPNKYYGVVKYCDEDGNYRYEEWENLLFPNNQKGMYWLEEIGSQSQQQNLPIEEEIDRHKVLKFVHDYFHDRHPIPNYSQSDIADVIKAYLENIKPQPSTPSLSPITDEELEREAAELYPNNNEWADNTSINILNAQLRAAHIKARKMSIRLKEREIAEKALRNFDPFNETITDFLDTNYPTIPQELKQLDVTNNKKEELNTTPQYCTCTKGTVDNPVLGGYARCPLHDPNMLRQKTGLDALKSIFPEKIKVKHIFPGALNICDYHLENGEVITCKPENFLSEYYKKYPDKKLPKLQFDEEYWKERALAVDELIKHSTLITSFEDTGKGTGSYSLEYYEARRRYEALKKLYDDRNEPK